MEANKRKKIGWILLWVVGTVFLFGSAGCKKKSAQTGQAGFPSSTTGQTTFTNPDDAATKTFGSLSVASDNIITARASQSEMITGRMITGRMITGRMITGRVITARIITGRIITARSPKFIDVSESDNNNNEDDILNLFGRLKKGRLSKKQSEGSEISCEDVKPKCVEGKVEKADCNKDQSTNRLNFDIKLSDCKEIVDEQKGDYIVSTGYAKGYLEISTKVSQGGGEAKFIFAIEEGDSLVKEFIGNKETKRVRAKSSKFRTEITGRFIEGEKDVDFRVVTKLSGSYSREDEIGNRKEAYSYNDYVVELTGKSPKSGGEPIFYMSITGGYSVDTEPASCVEGSFNFKTIKPIKSSGQGYCGAESGEIEVNNAKIEFSSGKVKVSVENQQEEYGCNEVGALCKYEPITIAEGVEQKPCPVWFKDADGDGYTDGVTKVSCEQPDGYVSQAQTGDCNDNDKNINPSTVWFKDADKDGYTDGTTKVSCEKPSDEYVSSATAGDCDDNDTNINPVRAEICDGLDNNCNGTIDDGVLLVFYKDADGDGYTDGATQVGCSAPQGYVSSATSGDCNDSDSSMKPGRAEICDSKDNNCNGQIDEGVLLVFYRDQDGDGYGYANNSTQACSQPAGYVSNSSDCDDNNANLHPNTIWFKDADFDGYYPAGGSSVSCNNPFAPNNATYVAIPGGDCNDTNPSIHPGAPLNCNNGLDNDCSGNVEKWAYTDQDGDRYAPNNVSSCIDVVSFPGKITAGQELGYNDCNDNNASIYPGAPLNCNNGQDNDCSGNIEKWAYTDQDGDKFAPNSTSSCVDVVNFPGKITAGYELGTNDCNDNNASINPNTVWFKDADSDGYYPAGGSQVSCTDPYPENSTYSAIPPGDCDDNNPTLNPNTIWFKDADLDGFYPAGGSSVSCNNPFAPNNATYVAIPGGDCNDTNSSIHPGAPLNCNNGLDNDCSGNVEKWAYTDQDGDRYAPNSTSSCVDVVNFPGKITAGYELGTNDCNDTSSSIYPGAPLNCNNGQDNDCSGNVEKWAYTDQDGDLYAPNNVSSCVDFIFFPGQITAGQELGTNDCNDTNVSIYPGAPLNCNNGQDNDCSGNVEKWAYTDVDGDRYAPNSTSSCVDVVNFPGKITAGQQLGTNDCNDSNSSINPSAPDNTCDSIDNNCNLYVDENTAPCFAPTSFGIYSWGLTYVSLRWTYPSPSSNVEKFVIQRSPNGITYVDVAEAPASATNYTIRTYLTSKYYFRVYAKNATGSGSPSSVTSAPIGVNSLFEKTIGGSSDEAAHSIIQSSDGGYVVAGYTTSFGAGDRDMYVVKLDSSGNVQWTKTIGGSNRDEANSIIQSSDGGYVVAGFTGSYGGFYVVKLDSVGNIEWTKRIGPGMARSIIQSSDGGYVVAGHAPGVGSLPDFYVVKLDSGGNVEWAKKIGGSDDDEARSIIQSSDGGYVVAGWTRSFGAGPVDIYVVKLDSGGNVQWTKTIGILGHDFAYSIIQSSDGGYVVVGDTESFEGFYVVKLDSAGNIEWTKRIGCCGAWSIIRSSDEGYVVAGDGSPGAGGLDFYVVKLDSSGNVEWTKTIGGSSSDVAYSIIQSSDGGYVVAGMTSSFGAGGADFYVVKLAPDGTLGCHDSFQNPSINSGGNEAFQTPLSSYVSPSSSFVSPVSYSLATTDIALCMLTFAERIGGSNDDFANSIIQSSDGGYVVAGYTNSFGGSYDFYVVKLYSSGSVAWTKTIGGSGDDQANSVVQSSDGGYIVAGYTTSFGASGADMYVVKLGSGGNVQWTKTIGGSDDDFANSVIQSSDGGYVIAGYTQSFGAGGYDMYVVKLDSNGNVVWTKTIGGSNSDVANSIVQSSDGGYVVAGETLSFGASGRDIYVVKLDSSGNIVWTKTIGGSWDDFANSVIQSSDGGYVIAGYTQSFGASWYDIYVVKLDSSGNVIWSKTIGGGNADVAYSIIQSSDGGYIVIGRTQSFGAGGYDVYVVKIDSSGNVLWTKTIGGGSADEARSIIQSSDGGFAIAGYTQSFGAGLYDIYVVKTGPLGDTCWSQGITNYVVSSVSSSFSSPSTDAFPQSPTVTVVSPASGSGGSVSSVCFSAGAPPVPMCLISGGCDYYQGGSDMDKVMETMKGVERERERSEVKSYGCSAGGVLSRFLIPASVLIIIYGWFRFRKKRKV
jgi:uncharacterized delta-60 repeat protein